jgi:hypothetical protein
MQWGGRYGTKAPLLRGCRGVHQEPHLDETTITNLYEANSMTSIGAPVAS